MQLIKLGLLGKIGGAAGAGLQYTFRAFETFWVTGKLAGGFTIHSSNATSTAVVDWFIVR